MAGWGYIVQHTEFKTGPIQGTPMYFEAEPKSIHDANAVKVTESSGRCQCWGYVPRDILTKHRKALLAPDVRAWIQTCDYKGVWKQSRQRGRRGGMTKTMIVEVVLPPTIRQRDDSPAVDH